MHRSETCATKKGHGLEAHATGMRLKTIKLGFIPSNRGFFSKELAAKMRDQTIDVLKKLGIEVVVPDAAQTKVGCVETREEAELAAEMFRRAGVHGILVGAVNFGEEQGVAWCVKKAALNVPILIFGVATSNAFRCKHTGYQGPSNRAPIAERRAPIASMSSSAMQWRWFRR